MWSTPFLSTLARPPAWPLRTGLVMVVVLPDDVVHDQVIEVREEAGDGAEDLRAGRALPRLDVGPGGAIDAEKLGELVVAEAVVLLVRADGFDQGVHASIVIIVGDICQVGIETKEAD